MMRAALALARRSLGRTWPNPAVGCVIVKDGRIVARGRTQDGGRPHAEVDALNKAGDVARDATVYVTLEPCSHFGKSPPCADALVRAGVARVVSAMADPNPAVNGRGHARLREAGLTVDVGEGAREAAEINAGFLLRVSAGRPLFHLKLASSLDGRIATASGESKWITGEGARADGHRLRAVHDAILVGADCRGGRSRPECRLRGSGPIPGAHVLDSKAGLAGTQKLATTARRTVFSCARVPQRRARRKPAQGGREVIEVPAAAMSARDPSPRPGARQRGLTGCWSNARQVAAAFLKAA